MKRSSSPHRALINTILNTSRNREDFKIAAREWHLELMSYSGASMNCDACGQKIQLVARIDNDETGAKLRLGVDCFTRMCEAFRREGVTEARLSEREYRRRREAAVSSRVRELVRERCTWEIPDLEYGSWKTWFLERADKNRIPSDLLDGIRELRSVGVLSSDELVNKFCRYHNARRKFPSHTLLPHLRLQGLHHSNHSVPATITVDEAIAHVPWGTPSDELRAAVFSRICELYKCPKRPLGARLAAAYNLVISLVDGYQQCKSAGARQSFISQHVILRRDPILENVAKNMAAKKLVDLEFRNTIRMLAGIILPSFENVASSDYTAKYLAPRLQHVTRSGERHWLWGSAAFRDADAEQIVEDPPEALALDEDSQTVTSAARVCGIVSEDDKELRALIRDEWEHIYRFPAEDLVIHGHWIYTLYQNSCIIVCRKRYRSVVLLGLNCCWRSASPDERAAQIRVMLRDIATETHVWDDIRIARSFLERQNISSFLGTDPAIYGSFDARNALARLQKRYSDFNEVALNKCTKRVVAEAARKSVYYDRWSHILFVPARGAFSHIFDELGMVDSLKSSYVRLPMRRIGGVGSRMQISPMENDVHRARCLEVVAICPPPSVPCAELLVATKRMVATTIAFDELDARLCRGLPPR